MKNAEMWQLAGDPKAPASSSMRQLCWECRVKATSADTEHASAKEAVLREAEDVVRRHQSTDK
jgi:hypothetical protein